MLPRWSIKILCELLGKFIMGPKNCGILYCVCGILRLENKFILRLRRVKQLFCVWEINLVWVCEKSNQKSGSTQARPAPPRLTRVGGSLRESSPRYLGPSRRLNFAASNCCRAQPHQKILWHLHNNLKIFFLTLSIISILDPEKYRLSRGSKFFSEI